jgi:signal transduction histidine kinase
LIIKGLLISLMNGLNVPPKELSPQKALPQVSFRSILVVPFLVQVVFAVGLTGYFTIRNGQKEAENFALQLQANVGKRIDQHLSSYLATPQQLAYLNYQAIQSKLLNPQDLKPFESFFVTQMQLFPEVGYLNFGRPSGEFIGVERRDRTLLIGDVEQTAGKNYSRSFQLNAAGGRGKLLTREPLATGITQEGWFRDAVKAKGPIWTNVYPWADAPEVLSISASHPIYDAQHRLVGVVGADLILMQICDFLQSLSISPNGRAFLLERDGRLIATSAQIPLVRSGSRLSAIDAADPLIRQSATALKQRFGTFQQIKSATQLSFFEQGQQQIAYVVPWKDAYGLDWLIVVAAPAADFTTVVTANTQSTLMIMLAAVTIATGLGILTARWIARPVMRLSDATQALATAADAGFGGDEGGEIQVRSPVREVNQLARSFQRMASQLRNSFQDLAQANNHLEARVDARTEELSQALDRLQTAQVQMIQAEKMSSLGQMVAGVTHEINNPINFIHANLRHTGEYTKRLLEVIDLYQREHPIVSPDLQEYLAKADLQFIQTDLPKVLGSMQNGTKRVQEIVDGLKSFSRLDEAAMKTVNLQESIDSTLLLLKHRLTPTVTDPEIIVIKHYVNLPEAECYAGQLNQVFFHILNNAIDAIAASYQLAINQKQDLFPGLISITTMFEEPNSITISIADTGVGINPAIRPKIFDPFFTTKPIGQGVGLSLSIDYQIVVEQHGGRLTCTSIPSEGSEFVIQIPLMQGDR